MSPELDRREWITRCLQSASALALVSATLGAENWAPKFFSEDQNFILVSLGEALIPGSAAAHCNQVIDEILTIESVKNQAEIRSALDTFKAFPSSTPEQQADMLTAASTPRNSMATHFELIKEWVADTYWSSEQGLKELGWNGQMAWAKYPGCEKAGT